MHIILQNRQIIMFLYGPFLQVVNSYKFLYDFNEMLIVDRARTPCSSSLPPNSFHELSFEIAVFYSLIKSDNQGDKHWELMYLID